MPNADDADAAADDDDVALFMSTTFVMQITIVLCNVIVCSIWVFYESAQFFIHLSNSLWILLYIALD